MQKQWEAPTKIDTERTLDFLDNLNGIKVAWDVTEWIGVGRAFDASYAAQQLRAVRAEVERIDLAILAASCNGVQ
jgi:hypothetical protein